MSKIKIFRDLLDAGKTREEARDESGVSDSTSKIQFSLWNKGLTKFTSKKTESPKDNQVANQVNDDEEEEEDDVEVVEE